MDYIIKNLGEEIGNNKIIAKEVTFTDSSILFRDKNNILFIEDGADIRKCDIKFLGSNSLVYIGKIKHNCSFQVNRHHNSVFHIGKNNSVNGRRPIFQLSEQKNIFLGNDNMMSFDISVRVADPHLIYDATSKKRINDSKSWIRKFISG